MHNFIYFLLTDKRVRILSDLIPYKVYRSLFFMVDGEKLPGLLATLALIKKDRYSTKGFNIVCKVLNDWKLFNRLKNILKSLEIKSVEAEGEEFENEYSKTIYSR